MALRSTAPVLLLLALALCPASASADHYDFSITPDPPNEDRVTTFAVQPALDDGDRIRWDLDNDGDFDDGLTSQVSRTYFDPGPVTVRMQVTGHSGGAVTKTVTVNGAPGADFALTPASPLEGQEITFIGEGTDPEGDDLTFEWDFDDGSTGTGATASHAYTAPGTYDVVMTVTDEHGAFASKSVSVPVAPDPGPDAGFEVAPAAPLTGEEVTFTSTSAPSQGSITALEWDLDGDGDFDEAGGPSATWSYSEAGSHLVQLRVRQANGREGVAFTHVEVGERPPPPGDPPADGSNAVTDPPAGSGPIVTPLLPLPPASRPVRMRPFPVVRIAGVVLPKGADVTILSVRAPRGALVRARCRGRGCPVGSLVRRSASGLIRLRGFERRLRAGISIQIFVRKPGTIGKYTRFLIRAGKAPARVDRCLFPGRERPGACP